MGNKVVSKEDIQKIRSRVMYDVLEAKSYLILADDVISIVGEHNELVQLICNHMTQSDEFREVIIDSLGSIIKTCGMIQGGEGIDED